MTAAMITPFHLSALLQTNLPVVMLERTRPPAHGTRIQHAVNVTCSSNQYLLVSLPIPIMGA